MQRSHCFPAHLTPIPFHGHGVEQDKHNAMDVQHRNRTGAKRFLKSLLLVWCDPEMTVMNDWDFSLTMQTLQGKVRHGHKDIN